eukprot:18580-Heterococcus_DN1.PRE.2
MQCIQIEMWWALADILCAAIVEDRIIELVFSPEYLHTEVLKRVTAAVKYSELCCALYCYSLMCCVHSKRRAVNCALNSTTIATTSSSAAGTAAVASGSSPSLAMHGTTTTKQCNTAVCERSTHESIRNAILLQLASLCHVFNEPLRVLLHQFTWTTSLQRMYWRLSMVAFNCCGDLALNWLQRLVSPDLVTKKVSQRLQLCIIASTALQQRTAVVPAVILLWSLLTTVKMSPLMMTAGYLSSIGSSGSLQSSEQHPTWYADDIADRYKLARHALEELSEYKCAARSAALAKGLIAVSDDGDSALVSLVSQHPILLELLYVCCTDAAHTVMMLCFTLATLKLVDTRASHTHHSSVRALMYLYLMYMLKPFCILLHCCCSSSSDAEPPVMPELDNTALHGSPCYTHMQAMWHSATVAILQRKVVVRSRCNNNYTAGTQQYVWLTTMPAITLHT